MKLRKKTCGKEGVLAEEVVVEVINAGVSRFVGLESRGRKEGRRLDALMKRRARRRVQMNLLERGFR